MAGSIKTFGEVAAAQGHQVPPYTDISVEDHLLSADQIVSKWNEDRRDLSRKITVQDIGRIRECFPFATTCSCRVVGQTCISGVCVGCLVVGRLYDNGVIHPEKSNVVRVGKYTGKQFRVRSLPFDFKGYKPSPESNALSLELAAHLSNYEICEPAFIPNLDTYMCLSSLEHSIVVSSIIEYEMVKRGIPCYPLFLWGWGCENSFNLVESVPSFNSVSDLIGKYEFDDGHRLRPEVIRGIIFQLVSILRFLMDYTFTHGTPSVGCLAFDNQPASYTYDNLSIESPITLRFNPSEYSAISVRDRKSQNILRISHHEPTQNNDLQFHPQILTAPYIGRSYTDDCLNHPDERIPSSERIPSLTSYLEHRIIGYRIGSDSLSLTKIQNLGIPLFHSSFDLYAFLVGLMSFPHFYQSIISDPRLLDLWTTLWDPTEYEIMMNDLQHLPPSPTPNIVVQFLASRILRCDAIAHFWNGLKHLS